MLQTLIYSEKLNQNNVFCEKLQIWGNPGLQLVLLKNEMPRPGQVDLEHALWIVTEENEWDYGSAHGIAMLPCMEEKEWERRCENGEFHFEKADVLALGFEEITLEYLERVYRRAHGLPWVIAETERFVLRELTLNDVEALFQLYDDQSLYPYLEPLKPREEEILYQGQYIKNRYHLLGFGMWLVCEPKTGHVIGRAGLEPSEEDPEILELGYLIKKEYRGRGLAEEVCRAIIRFVEEELDYRTITCAISPENLPSIRLAEKLGFRLMSKSGIFRYQYNILPG